MFAHHRSSFTAKLTAKAFNEGQSNANRTFLPSPDNIRVGQRFCIPDFASG